MNSVYVEGSLEIDKQKSSCTKHLIVHKHTWQESSQGEDLCAISTMYNTNDRAHTNLSKFCVNHTHFITQGLSDIRWYSCPNNCRMFKAPRLTNSVLSYSLMPYTDDNFTKIRFFKKIKLLTLTSLVVCNYVKMPKII